VFSLTGVLPARSYQGDVFSGGTLFPDGSLEHADFAATG